MELKSGIQIYFPDDGSKFIKLLPPDSMHSYRSEKIGEKFFKFYYKNGNCPDGKNPETEIKKGVVALSLHDVGKTNYMKTLDKKKLSRKELREVCPGHTSDGYIILKKMDMPEDVSLAALYHHENWDMTGYPVGVHGKMGGKKIPLFARLVKVVDVFDTMINNKRISSERRILNVPSDNHVDEKIDMTMEKMSQMKGINFDPYIFSEFESMLMEPGMRDDIICLLEEKKEYFKVKVPEEIMH